MKSAILISGQPRNVQECYENIYSNIISPNDSDVFIHTWIDENMFGKQYVANWVKKEAILVQKDDPNKDKYCDIASNIIPSNIEDIIIKLYSPKKYLFEKPKLFEYNSVLDRKRAVYLEPQDCLSFFYSMYAANIQRQIYEYQNKIQYDIIMRIRFDTIFNQPINFKLLEDLSYIYVPPEYNDPQLSTHDPHQIGLSDRWSIGNNYNMTRYTQIYPNIENMVINEEAIICNEFLVGYWLQKKLNAPIKRLYFPYYIKRI